MGLVIKNWLKIFGTDNEYILESGAPHQKRNTNMESQTNLTFQIQKSLESRKYLA